MSKFRNFEKYEVYPDGRIWSYSRKKFLKPQTSYNGYQRVLLSDNEGKRKKYLLHRVIYETFSGSPIPNNLQCNHIDEDKKNCSFANINLMTPKQNTNWGTGISRRAKTNTNNPKHSKQVGAYRNGELVMTFKSTAEAQRNGFKSGSISKCCRCERKTHKGFEWRYL